MDEYSRKRQKKNKKEKDKKRKQSKHSSSESDDEWVEKDMDEKTTKHLTSESVSKIDKEENGPRDGWMSMEMDFSKFGAEKEIKKDPEVEKAPANEPGQSNRELNPYWRNGGSGLPPEKRDVENLRKDRRDSEDSEKHRPDISKEMEIRRSDKYYSSDRNRSDRSRERSHRDERWKDKSSHHERRNRDEESRSSRYKDDNYKSDRSKNDYSKSFKKPDDDYDDYSRDRNRRGDKRNEESRESPVSSSSSKRGWKKNRNSEERSFDSMPSSSKSEEQDSKSAEISSTYEMDIIEQTSQKILSVDELNMLCAKMLKAELKGNRRLANELRVQVENARRVRDKANTSNEDVKEREVIILTETDSKGFSRPLKSVREDMAKSKKKVETHEGNKRVRYFADDDSLTLSEMFEKERFGSSRDQNATFIKLMGKEMSEKNEDAFEETASFDNVSRQEKKDWDNAVRNYSQKEKAMDSCGWCLDSKNANQDVIVAIRNRVHLCVPSSQSLTEGHCIIVPSDHIPCATLLDEDVWEDIMNLRKNLVKIFEAEDEDIVFFECASNLEKYPHMLLHCVPIPKEMGDVAPIYFKKAIMECEMEWSNNKKVVDLAGRNVRKAIPKGLPYFAVDFGMQSGYAHVIEDKRLFPKNFAQEIIGGMLDIDHSKWRKLHKDSHENIQKKIDYLKQLIEKNL